MTEDEIVEALFAVERNKLEIEEINSYEARNEEQKRGKAKNLEALEALTSELKTKEKEAIDEIKKDKAVFVRVLVKIAERDAAYRYQKEKAQTELTKLLSIEEAHSLKKLNRGQKDRLKYLKDKDAKKEEKVKEAKQKAKKEGRQYDDRMENNPNLGIALDKIYKDKPVAKANMKEVLLSEGKMNSSTTGQKSPAIYNQLKKKARKRKEWLYWLKEMVNGRWGGVSTKTIKEELEAQAVKAQEAQEEAQKEASNTQEKVKTVEVVKPMTVGRAASSVYQTFTGKRWSQRNQDNGNIR